jgi:hypothetical protein
VVLSSPFLYNGRTPGASKEHHMPADLPRIDWDAITEEATQLLSDFIRIDTSNPPGREKAACDWLAGLLRKEGIDDMPSTMRRTARSTASSV